MATSGGSLSVQSLHRALTILETVGNHPAPITLRQLTEKTELPKPTVYRLLRNLEDRRYVSCDSNGHYRLGNRVGGCPLIEQPTSHTTVRTVRYTAVQ